MQTGRGGRKLGLGQRWLPRCLGRLRLGHPARWLHLGCGCGARLERKAVPDVPWGPLESALWDEIQTTTAWPVGATSSVCPAPPSQVNPQSHYTRQLPSPPGPVQAAPWPRHLFPPPSPFQPLLFQVPLPQAGSGSGTLPGSLDHLANPGTTPPHRKVAPEDGAEATSQHE